MRHIHVDKFILNMLVFPRIGGMIAYFGTLLFILFTFTSTPSPSRLLPLVYIFILNDIHRRFNIYLNKHENIMHVLYFILRKLNVTNNKTHKYVHNNDVEKEHENSAYSSYVLYLFLVHSHHFPYCYVGLHLVSACPDWCGRRRLIDCRRQD